MNEQTADYFQHSFTNDELLASLAESHGFIMSKRPLEKDCTQEQTLAHKEQILSTHAPAPSASE